MHFALHIPSQVFGNDNMPPLLRLSLVSTATSMEMALNHSFALDPSFWGHKGMLPWITGTSMTNWDPFLYLLSTITFEQMAI